MAINFKFVNRYDLFEQAKEEIIKIYQGRGVLRFNLYGYWGAAGIGKTRLLNEIERYIKEVDHIRLMVFNCKKSDEKYNALFKFMNLENREPAIVIVDHLEELIYQQKYTDRFRDACDSFIKKNMPRRIIFCASRFPDFLTTLLRAEWRAIQQIGAMMLNDTSKMLSQIYPDIDEELAGFLNKYAAGYPQVVAIFCEILQEGKEGDKHKIVKETLIRLIETLNPDIKSDLEKSIFLRRLCSLSLTESFMPEIGKSLLDFISKQNSNDNIHFEDWTQFNGFIQQCLHYSIFLWDKNDYLIYEPLKQIFRLYLEDFEAQLSLDIYDWLAKEYQDKYKGEKGKEKGRYLLKLAFYIYKAHKNFEDDAKLCLRDQGKELASSRNTDVVDVITHEIKSSEIGKILGFKKFSDLIK